MSESIKLKSSLLGGYSKNEVLKTIEQLSERVTAEEEKYKEEIGRVKNENRVLTEEVRSYKNRIQELESELEEKNQKIEQLVESVKSAEFEVENKRNEYYGLKKEVERTKDQQHEKEAHYEKMSRGIGDMMVNVKFTCDSIVANSKKEVGAVIGEANREVYEIGSRVKKSKQQFAASRGQIIDYIKNIEESLDRIYEQLDTAEAELLQEKILEPDSKAFEDCETEVENKIADIIDLIKNA